MSKILKAFGCFFVRKGKGDHEIWHSPIKNCNVSVDEEIRSRHSANALLKKVGIPCRFR